MALTDNEVIKLPPGFLKILMVIIALATCTGSLFVYVDQRYATEVATNQKIEAVKELNRTEIDNVKTNYEFHIKEIHKDLREIRNVILKAK